MLLIHNNRIFFLCLRLPFKKKSRVVCQKILDLMHKKKDLKLLRNASNMRSFLSIYDF